MIALCWENYLLSVHYFPSLAASYSVASVDIPGRLLPAARLPRPFSPVESPATALNKGRVWPRRQLSSMGESGLVSALRETRPYWPVAWQTDNGQSDTKARGINI